MSWYIGVDIYTKKESESWKPEMVSNYWLMAKSLCENRGTLDSMINPATLSDEDRKELEQLEHQYDEVEDVLVATIHKDSWKNVVAESDFKYRTAHHEETNMVHFYVEDEKSEAIAKKYDVDSAEYINAVADKRDSEYLSIYKKRVNPRGYNGSFYDARSFYDYSSKMFDHLEKLLVEKADWERTRKSLDYQKLSEEEKANVGDEYECLDEDITEYRCKYEAAVSMANILDFYSKEYGTKVVAYMFGT